MHDKSLQSSDSETSQNSSSDDETSPPLLALMSTVETALKHLAPSVFRLPLHDSRFTGRMRLDEWQHRHSGGMHSMLGVEPDSFNFLLSDLETFGGLEPSRWVEADEKLAIYLYITRSACGVRHAAETFQRSLETTANCYHQVLDCMTSGEFYSRWVTMPDGSEPPQPQMVNDSRFDKWFGGCIGAIDGTHIVAHPPVEESSTYRTRKGALTMNVLAAASFNLKFIYVLSGWEGSAHDGKLWAEATGDDLKVPSGKFLLADAGFSTCRELLVPFRGTRYHLQEWAKSKQRPAKAKELYNLRHSSARNVIERIFGVAKRRWAILARGCEYDLETQARMVYGVAVLHNMLRTHENKDDEAIPSDAELRREALTQIPRTGDDEQEEAISAAWLPPRGPRAGLMAERAAAEAWRGEIAQDMWNDYVEGQRRRAVRRSESDEVSVD